LIIPSAAFIATGIDLLIRCWDEQAATEVRVSIVD
jgi:hypothetical protein